MAETGTKTATAGDADFNAETATAVIANVDGTSASVSAALADLNSGSLAGQVPGVGLINALASAQADFATFETTNKAAVDALATTLKLTVAPGTEFGAELQAVSDAADLARENASEEADTGVLTARAATAATHVTEARTALTSPEAALAAKYDAAVAAEVTALKGVATATEIGAATGGLTADTTAAAGLAALGTNAPSTPAVPAVLATQDDVDNGDATTVGEVLEAAVPAGPLVNTPATAAAVYDRYVNGTTADRTAIDTALKDSSFYATFKATALKDAAAADATKAVAAADDALDNTVAGQNYIDAVSVKTSADKLVADAQAADTNKAAVDAIVKAYAAADTKVDNAGTALSVYNETHTTTKTVALTSGAADSTVKEAFYFDSKIVASDDFTIGTTGAAATHFGTGDAIVLGTSLTYNSGALSTGDNNKAEFFLVQKGSDTLVVIETSVFGSSTTTHTATGDAALTSADSVNAAVITLTGVAVADLAVSNGVISYHAAAVA